MTEGTFHIFTGIRLDTDEASTTLYDALDDLIEALNPNQTA